MASNVDELTITYEEDGLMTVKELDKVILSKGAWATIIFKYQSYEKKNEDFGPNRYTIRRYRKLDGEYRPQSKFNISSDDQAKKIVAALTGWLED